MFGIQHCDYQYQTVAGTLDSYPVVQSSDCTFQATSTNSSTTPTYIQDAGNISWSLGMLGILLIILIGIKIIK